MKKLKLKKGWLLQVDHNPKHTSKYMVHYIKRRKLKISPRLLHPSELNRTENPWIDVKRAVCNRDLKQRLN